MSLTRLLSPVSALEFDSIGSPFNNNARKREFFLYDPSSSLGSSFPEFNRPEIIEPKLILLKEFNSFELMHRMCARATHRNAFIHKKTPSHKKPR
jgi:hypothetical protein